jgi:Divergent InlB B-repeat domain
MLSATYGSVKYSITTPSWLTASPNSGTVATSAKAITFTINSSAHSLQPNTYVNSITFNNTTNNQGNTTRVATLTVNPKQDTITVRASPSADGTVSGGGTFAAGTSHTVTATPNTGHTFVHWTENGRVVSTCSRSTAMSPWSLTFDNGAVRASAPAPHRKSALKIARWWHCQHDTSSDSTPLARMLPRVIGGLAQHPIARISDQRMWSLPMASRK